MSVAWYDSEAIANVGQSSVRVVVGQDLPYAYIAIFNA